MTDEMTGVELELHIRKLRAQTDKCRTKKTRDNYSEPHRIIEMSPLCKDEDHCIHATCTRLCCLCGFIKED